MMFVADLFKGDKLEAFPTTGMLFRERLACKKIIALFQTSAARVRDGVRLVIAVRR